MPSETPTSPPNSVARRSAQLCNALYPSSSRSRCCGSIAAASAADTPNALASGMVALASDVYLQQGQEASHPGACAVLEYFINLQKSVKLVCNGGSNFLQILPQSQTWAIVKAWVYFELWDRAENHGRRPRARRLAVLTTHLAALK